MFHMENVNGILPLPVVPQVDLPSQRLVPARPVFAEVAPRKIHSRQAHGRGIERMDHR